MRTLIILTLILAAFLGLSTWGYYYIDGTARDMTGHINKSEQAAASNDWTTAQDEITQMFDKWQKTKSVWTLLVDHEEMDNIDTAVSRVKQALKTKDQVETRAGLAELKMFIEHIPEKEALTLENIL